MARRYKFERILEELRKGNSRRETWESLGLCKKQLYNYMRLMQKEGLLDENYNIIEKQED